MVLHPLIDGAEERQETVTERWNLFTIVVVVLNYSDTRQLWKMKRNETRNITKQTCNTVATESGIFNFSCINFFYAKVSLYFDRIETTLKSLIKSFPYWYCSSMTVPTATQPNIQLGLSNQTHIALNLFDTILKTANTREELECSWAVIEQYIITQEQQEARQWERRNPH